VSTKAGQGHPDKSSDTDTGRTVGDIWDSLPVGDRTDVRVVPSEEALDDIWDELSGDGADIDWDGYEGTSVRLPDGYEVGKRSSKKYGSTIDIREPDGTYKGKIHIG
jgi:hypothetical protein